MAVFSTVPPQLVAWFGDPENLPRPGRTHLWLPQAAGRLVRYLPPEEIVAFLETVVARHVRHRTIGRREVEDAVAYAVRQETGKDPAIPKSTPDPFPWPAADEALIESVLHDAPRLFDDEPIDSVGPADVLRGLFDKSDLVCFSPDKFAAVIAPVDQVVPVTQAMQFIVPNPMKGKLGLSKPDREGKRHPAPRVQSNIRARRFLVLEFDRPDIAKPDQSRLLNVLRQFAHLTLVVDSAGKSLHGWFDVEGLHEADIAALMLRACYLGADPAMFNSCAWCRMPFGSRRFDFGIRTQHVMFWAGRKKGTP